MKRPARKLSLSRQTLRSLSADEARAAAGGYETIACPTFICPPPSLVCPTRFCPTLLGCPTVLCPTVACPPSGLVC